ncbi:hypothetical protein V6R21_28190 [Limibacter armeniacum]|uniref:hypothetical protein n=1 Tax=Limibacter armeniacum TaxID=466084 RepID=UPI002FE5227D
MKKLFFIILTIPLLFVSTITLAQIKTDMDESFSDDEHMSMRMFELKQQELDQQIDKALQPIGINLQPISNDKIWSEDQEEDELMMDRTREQTRGAAVHLPTRAMEAGMNEMNQKLDQAFELSNKASDIDAQLEKNKEE